MSSILCKSFSGDILLWAPDDGWWGDYQNYKLLTTDKIQTSVDYWNVPVLGIIVFI